MKINIYYGGRGLLDDPTLYVIGKMENVLRELRVKVERYNIYEHKNEIATLPQTFKDVDGIILATTVEWLGIGGYMQQFLDACWLYGDKEKIAQTYMQPIVMSTTYGEREVIQNIKCRIVQQSPSTVINIYFHSIVSSLCCNCCFQYINFCSQNQYF